MPRNRSRSRSRERRRSRSRDRERRRHGDHGESHKRHRSRSPQTSRRRSRSPRRRSRSGSRDRSYVHEAKNKALLPERPKIDEAQLEGMTEEDADMMRTMGFAGFDSTKGKKVGNNNIYVAKLQQKRRYRQYMNRRGGFNRPLDFIA